MEPRLFTTHRFVKSEDLNHHGSLYAGRTAEWFVEAGYIAAASLTSPKNTVCLQIHGMKFTSPIRCGELIHMESKVVYTGRSRLISFVRIQAHDKVAVEGFLTFIHVDAEGNSQPHGIEIIPVTDEDKELYKKAQEL
jgi:acyl-CoA hydrolase